MCTSLSKWPQTLAGIFTMPRLLPSSGCTAALVPRFVCATKSFQPFVRGNTKVARKTPVPNLFATLHQTRASRCTRCLPATETQTESSINIRLLDPSLSLSSATFQPQVRSLGRLFLPDAQRSFQCFVVVSGFISSLPRKTPPQGGSMEPKSIRWPTARQTRP